MKTGFRVVAAFVVCIAGLIVAAEKAEKYGSGKNIDQAEKTAEKLRQQVREEIKTLGIHAWVGDYYWGDGLGANISLILAPQAGFLFEWHGCVGLYDRNYGAVIWANDRLRLSF